MARQNRSSWVSRKKILLIGVSLLALFLLFRCEREAPPPAEEEIRAYIEKAVAAVEGRDLNAAMDLVSGDYQDDTGNDKLRISGVLRVVLMRNRTLHLAVRTPTITFPENNLAEALIYVAVAGNPISSSEDWVLGRLDLYRFEVRLKKEKDDWLLIWSNWRRATREDLI
jgi:hypothetical protein